LLQNLLDDAECDAVVALARDRLQRSPVVNPDTGDENLIDARTSMGAMFQVGEHALLQRIEARIAAVTGWPVEHGEGQVLNYKPGGEYQPHFDFFNPKRPGEARQLRVGGQRVATMVIYLNSPASGGATAFPRIGLEVAPVKGNAVLFSYGCPMARSTSAPCTRDCRWRRAKNGSLLNGCASIHTAAGAELAFAR
jgi:prolyl 4-hydroxylase